MSLFDFFKINKERNFGVISLKRTTEPVEFNEIVAKAAIPEWKTNKSLRSFPTRWQDGSFSCVAHTLCLEAGIEYQNKYGYFIEFSPAFNYFYRVNKTSTNKEGMFIDNAYDISRDVGYIPYDLLPSDGWNEDQMNNVIIKPWFLDIAKNFRIGVDGKPAKINLPIDIDLIASVIQTTKKGVSLLLSIGSGEWLNQQEPKIKSNPIFKHEVLAIDFYLKNGEKYLRIQDSADRNTPFKDISENYLKQRTILCEYGMTFRFEISPGKLSFDGSIKTYQDILKAEGLFPKNISSSGFWGPITIQATKDFSNKYNLNLTKTDGFSSELIAKLTELYS